MGDHADDAMERGCENWDWIGRGEEYRRAPPKEEGDLCKCGGELVIRMNRSTKVRFLGCSNYPKCCFSAKLWEEFGHDGRFPEEGYDD